MQITATHINYYFVCKRKLWLFSNGINMEHTSDLVYEGKLIHENTYPQRSERYEELEINGCKIDYYDAKNKVVHEIKKSNKVEEAHSWQLKYYLLILLRYGIEATGILEYPTLRQTEKVELSQNDLAYLEQVEKEILKIISSKNCPEIEKKTICKKCSYYEFCYIGENE